MKKVCLIALLPWVMSCGWASSLFSSAPAEGEEPQITVAAADEPAPDDASAQPEAEEAAVSAEIPVAAAASAAVPTSASASAAQTPASTPPAGGAANAGAGSAAAVSAAPAVMTAPGPVTAVSPAPASQSTVSGGVYSISPVSYGVGNGMAEDSHSRVERRRMKVEEFARRIDSLVLSRRFLFLPNSMQEFPGGGLQMIYNVYFYLGVNGSRVEVHLPTTRGAFLPYVEILNFDTSELTDYRCSPAQSGWNISFGLANGEARYNVNMYVTPTTGETILTLYMNSAAIRYVGYIRDGAPEV